jgi:hypothetical protein
VGGCARHGAVAAHCTCTPACPIAGTHAGVCAHANLHPC